jgi:hypothetical protein
MITSQSHSNLDQYLNDQTCFLFLMDLLLLVPASAASSSFCMLPAAAADVVAVARDRSLLLVGGSSAAVHAFSRFKRLVGGSSAAAHAFSRFERLVGCSSAAAHALSCFKRLAYLLRTSTGCARSAYCSASGVKWLRCSSQKWNRTFRSPLPIYLSIHPAHSDPSCCSHAMEIPTARDVGSLLHQMPCQSKKLQMGQKMCQNVPMLTHVLHYLQHTTTIRPIRT